MYLSLSLSLSSVLALASTSRHLCRFSRVLVHFRPPSWQATSPPPTSHTRSFAPLVFPTPPPGPPLFPFADVSSIWVDRRQMHVEIDLASRQRSGHRYRYLLCNRRGAARLDWLGVTCIRVECGRRTFRLIGLLDAGSLLEVFKLYKQGDCKRVGKSKLPRVRHVCVCARACMSIGSSVCVAWSVWQPNVSPLLPISQISLRARQLRIGWPVSDTRRK